MRDDGSGVTSEVPDFVTHYHHREDAPFLNLCDLDGADLDRVLARLSARRRQDAGYKRIFGPRYMRFRRETEAIVRRLFEAAGGKPERRSPHYFVLGECAWFAGLYPSTGRVRLRLDDLDPDVTSFTYPDSFVAMRLGPNYGLPADPLRPYHERVFPIGDLRRVVSQFGMPDGGARDYDGYHRKPFEKYIEVQVWSDRSVLPFLARRSPL